MSAGVCYLCGREGRISYQVYLQDDCHAVVFVGPDCYSRTIKAGYDGARGRHGGPLVFGERRWAEAYACREQQAREVQP